MINTQVSSLSGCSLAACTHSSLTSQYLCILGVGHSVEIPELGCAVLLRSLLVVPVLPGSLPGGVAPPLSSGFSDANTWSAHGAVSERADRTVGLVVGQAMSRSIITSRHTDYHTGENHG